MKRIFGAFAVLCILAAGLSLHAQTYSFEGGAGFEPSSVPRTSGALSILVSPDSGKTFSSTSLLAKGPSGGHFTYSFVTGIDRLLVTQGKVSIFASAQGGVASSSSATSGALLGSGALVYAINPHTSIVLRGGVFEAPSDGGLSPQVGLLIRYTP